MTLTQRNYILDNFPEIFKTKSKADIFDILNALFFLIKIGCQCRLLPNYFPRWRMVYKFYRKWLSTGFFDCLTQELNAAARASQGNFGTSQFKPLNGRCVVKRTFSCLESFRRINRNYEQFLHS
ncbi:MAG: transposase [Bacteroides sp.]|nr:transposase [Bacteroides sp.]